MYKINLLEIINSNLTVNTIKSILFNEAEKESKKLFSDYERYVELYDIKRDIKIYAERQLRQLTNEITEELISDYILNMGNDEIFEALK